MFLEKLLGSFPESEVVAVGEIYGRVEFVEVLVRHFDMVCGSSEKDCIQESQVLDLIEGHFGNKHEGLFVVIGFNAPHKVHMCPSFQLPHQTVYLLSQFLAQESLGLILQQ